MGRALSILALAALALAACGPDPRSGVAPAADSPAEPASAPVSSLAAYVSSAAPASGAAAN